MSVGQPLYPPQVGQPMYAPGGGAYGGGAYAGGAAAGGAGADDQCGVQTQDQCGATCGNAPEENVLSHVPGGDYKAETTYKYVGQGQGDFNMVSVPTDQPRSCWLGLGFCLLLLLLVAIYWRIWIIGFPPPAPPPIEINPVAARGKCNFWGDPHFWTFDNPQGSRNGGVPSDAYPNGDYWIVKTPTIWIQGRYRPTNWLMHRPVPNDRACTRAIAFGGPFMQNNKFIIEAMESSTKSTTHDGRITYNGVPVLTTFPSTFSQGPVTARYHNQGTPLDVRMNMPLHIVDVSLPQNIHVQVDRWTEHLDGVIEMDAIPGMQGHCGNFNGNALDDQDAQTDPITGAHKPLSPAGPVSPTELLFPPTTFIDQHNFPKAIPQSDTYNARAHHIQTSNVGLN